MKSKIQSTLISGALAVFASFTVTSIAFNTFDWFRNHRAIAATSGVTGVIVFAISKSHVDRLIAGNASTLDIKKAIATELTLRLSDKALSEKEVEGLQEAIAIFTNDVTRLQEQSISQVTTLNQLF